MRRLRAEAGNTLPEVLAAASVGIVVLFGILGLLDLTTRQSAKTSDRVETTARVRLAMDVIGRQVRSQICLGTGLPAMTAADGNSMTFYASLAPEQPAGATTTPLLIVQRRELTYRPATKDILETVWTGDVGSVRPNVPFNGAPATQILASGVVPVDAATDVFRYYRFVVPTGGLVARPTRMTTLPLVAADLARTVQIEVNLAGVGARPETRVALSNTVFVRTASAADPDNSPLCV